MLYQNVFSYLEKPASEDELLIAGLMKKYFEALQCRDADELISLFRPEARIHSLAARGVVNLDQYARALRQELPLIRKVFFRDILIRVLNDKTAIVSGLYSYIYRGERSINWRRSWELQKDDGEWKIIESNYHHP